MYYYIFDSPKNYSESKLHERIKQHLTLLGISGETTLVSPARSASELAVMGVEKGYSTIVAVGGDELINEIGSNIQGRDVVLGIIPINTSDDILNLIGTNDFKEACKGLQKRHLKQINMGCLEPNVNFLTKVTIETNKPLSVQAEIDDFYFVTQTQKIVIDHNLGVHLINAPKQSGFFDSILNLWSKAELPNHNSYFNATRLRLRTHEIVPVKIGNLTVSKTPIVAFKKPEALKIIQNYSIMK